MTERARPALRKWREGQVGLLRGGTYAGRYVEVESEPRSPGAFHIWLSQQHPDEGPSDCWDIWADNADDVDAWFDGDLATVEWL